jgi:nitroreductase
MYPISQNMVSQLRRNNPRQVSEYGFPKDGAPEKKLKYILNYAVLAPSGHNMQPWRFRIVGSEIELYADRSQSLPSIDPHDRELIMSCGAALFHIRVALRRFGYEPIVRTFPDLEDPDLLAFIRIGKRIEPTLEDFRLFQAIKLRQTLRDAFLNRTVPQAELKELQEAALCENTVLHVVRDEERKSILSFINEAVQIQNLNPAFRNELASLMHSNQSKEAVGLPGYAYGLGSIASYLSSLKVRIQGEPTVMNAVELAQDAPALVILNTPHDNVIAWLEAGQAVARILLLAQDYHLVASFLNQPFQVESVRTRFKEQINATGFPQLMLRIGYGDKGPPTPRRSPKQMQL